MKKDLIATRIEPLAAQQVFESQPAESETRLPDDFEMREDGLYVSKGGDHHRIAGRFSIVSRTRDFVNDNHGVEIEFLDLDGEFHTVTIKQADLAARPAKVIEHLRRSGLFVRHGCGRFLVRALADATIVPTARCVEHVGWQNDRVFALPHETFGSNSEPVKTDDTLGKECGFGRAGTLDGWQNVAKFAQGNANLLFAAAVAFAGPLLAVIGADSTIFHLRGASSIGKTTAARFAASVWGRPSLVDGFMSSWRSTTNALELLANSRCDTCLILDEVQMAPANDVAAAAYMLSSGTGKQRMSRDLTKVTPPKWRMTALSTGEVSLGTYLQGGGRRSTGGQSVRFLDIAADAKAGYGLFQSLHDASSANDLANRISMMLAEHYGHAGPRFVAAIAENRVQAHGLATALITKFESHNCPEASDGQVRRVCAKFGLVAAAGALAAHFGIAPWSSDQAIAAAAFCFKAWLTDRGHIGSHEVTSGIEHLRTQILRNEPTAFAPWIHDGPRPKCGYRRDAPEALSGYYVHQWAMSDFLKAFDMKAVLEELKQKGHLLTDRDRLTKQAREPSSIRNTRFYCLTLAFVSDGVAADPSDVTT